MRCCGLICSKSSFKGKCRQNNLRLEWRHSNVALVHLSLCNWMCFHIITRRSTLSTFDHWTSNSIDGAKKNIWKFLDEKSANFSQIPLENSKGMHSKSWEELWDMLFHIRPLLDIFLNIRESMPWTNDCNFVGGFSGENELH